jgi:thioredoxin 1
MKAMKIIILFFLLSFKVISFAQNQANINTKKDVMKYKVTFVELGSVRCIPCQKMQPLMKAIEEKYGNQVKVVFYDVWTPEGKPYAKIYNIESIPTQVFLDENGKEFFRHVGFFEEEELVKVLKTKGVK